MFVLSQLGSEIDKNKFKMIFFMENNSLRKSDINKFDHIDPFGFSRNTLHNYSTKIPVHFFLTAFTRRAMFGIRKYLRTI